MDFGTIEIICRPCSKCRKAEEVLIKAIRLLESEYKTSYKYDIKRNSDLRQAAKYSANISCTPFIIINGNLAFAGKVTDVNAVRYILLSMMRSNRLPFR
ncbi:MAG: thioredoxin family protein [Candidatus Omnitrophica bacterium]|nr:thioredoxin family protein [Candidatus Omnitrophota bacterium]